MRGMVLIRPRRTGGVALVVVLVLGGCSSDGPTCDYVGPNIPFQQQLEQHLGLEEGRNYRDPFVVHWEGRIWLVGLPDFDGSPVGVWVTDVDPRRAFAPVERATILPADEAALAFSDGVKVGDLSPLPALYEVAADDDALRFARSCYPPPVP